MIKNFLNMTLQEAQDICNDYKECENCPLSIKTKDKVYGIRGHCPIGGFPENWLFLSIEENIEDD